MRMAAVGQTAAHWPQLTQSVSASFFPKAGVTIASEPRWAKSMAPTCCTSLQTLTQSPQRMHLLGSRMMEGEESSIGCCFLVLGKRMSLSSSLAASSCSRQVWFFSQTVQSLQWDARISSRIILLWCCSLGVLVFITMPCLGGVEQEAIRLPLSSSTMHMRHAP